MSQRKQSQGACAFCGQEMTKSGISRHLKNCIQLQEAIKASESNQKAGPKQRLYHMQIQDAWSSNYWLHLEITVMPI